jgi:hypothetical protein
VQHIGAASHCSIPASRGQQVRLHKLQPVRSAWGGNGVHQASTTGCRAHSATHPVARLQGIIGYPLPNVARHASDKYQRRGHEGECGQTSR